MITYKIIKNIVENESNIEDLSITKKTSYIRDCRFTYMKLCQKHIKDFTLQKCGNEINRTHASVINGLKKFEYDYCTPYFKANGIYDICNTIIEENIVDIIKLRKDILEFMEANNYFINSLETKENAIKVVNNYIQEYKLNNLK